MTGPQIARQVSLIFLCLVSSVVAAERIHAEPIWGDEGSFPQVVVDLLRRKEAIESPDNFYSSAREDRLAINEEVRNLSAVEGTRVVARLSVMSNENGVVSLLPDVTWGFPTRPAEELRTEGAFHLRQHSAVVLEETGSGAATTRLKLVVGETIKESEAKYLSWNDKVLVDFVVDKIELPSTRKKVLSTEEKMQLSREGKDPEGVKGPDCVVKISDLRFREARVPELVAVHRTWLWPGPGTLPYMLASYGGGEGLGGVGLSYLSEYASLNRFHGAAVFKLLNVGEEVSFSGRPMRSLQSEAGVKFAGATSGGEAALSVPLSEFSSTDAAKLQKRPKFVLLHFDATLSPISSTSNQYWNGVVIHTEKFRLGTDAEYAEAMRILPGLDEMATQYELAVQNDAELQLAAADQLAADEAKRKAEQAQRGATAWQSQARESAARANGQNEQPEDGKDVSLLEKVSKRLWARTNAGVFAGLLIAFGSAVYSAGLFLLGDHQN